MDWRGDDFIAQVEQKAARNVQAACIHLQNSVRGLLGTPNRSVAEVPITRGKNKGQTKKKLGPRGGNPSKPGEPPHKGTGFLRNSIAHQMGGEPAQPMGLVGSAYKVAKWLELGTAGGKIITAKNKKVLANKGLGLIFGKKVRQGAIAPRPFLRRALAEQRGRIHEIITNI